MAPLDTADIVILMAFAFVAGLVVGLMLGVPVGLAIRPRHRYRTRSIPIQTFSAASIAQTEIEPLNVALARNDENTLERGASASAEGATQRDATATEAPVSIDG